VSVTDVFTAIIRNEEDSLDGWLANGEIQDINILYKGCCASHHAAYYGRLSLLKKLASHGADFSKKNRYGETALDAARSGKHSETIEYLESVMKTAEDEVFIVNDNQGNFPSTETDTEAAAVEVAVACKHLRELFAPTIGEAHAESMADNMRMRLTKRFAKHWFPQEPTKGTGYRCISCTPGRLDPLLAASLRAALNLANEEEIAATLVPGRGHFALWVDPQHVSARIGENGRITTIYGSLPATTARRNHNKNKPLVNGSPTLSAESPAFTMATPPGLRKGLIIHDN